LTEQATGLVIIAFVGLTKLIGGRLGVKAGFVVLYLILFLFLAFMWYAVMSHFMMLRKMKQHSRDIINSVMQGTQHSSSADSFSQDNYGMVLSINIYLLLLFSSNSYSIFTIRANTV
jgi:hypothetical protein